MSGAYDWSSMDQQARIAVISKFAAKGFSAGEIASKIGNVSRNAIIGYVTRNGIKLKRGGVRKPRTVAKAPKPVSVAKTKSLATTAKKVEAGVESTPVMVEIPVAFRPSEPDNISWSTWMGDRSRPFDPLDGVEPILVKNFPRLGRCRWPVNGVDGCEPLFCGYETVPATNVYCTTHARFARPKEVSHGENS